MWMDRKEYFGKFSYAFSKLLKKRIAKQSFMIEKRFIMKYDSFVSERSNIFIQY